MLTEDKRKQLDTIVSQMTQNRESSNAIEFVVNDFKNKYSVPEPEKSFMEKTAGVLDVIFGGGKIGEAIGTKIAEYSEGGKALKEQEQKGLLPAGTTKETFKLPSAGQLGGSALQSASLFIPVGAVGKGITTGARALGLSKGVSALGKIGAGALSGYAFDISSNLQQGKTGKDALGVDLGTIIGGGLPALGVAKNVAVRFGSRQAPRVINSLIKPLQKDFAYGKNPGRAIAEEGIVANNFDDLINAIRTSRQRIGAEIGTLGDTLSEKPLLSIKNSFSPIDDAIKVAASQNNQTLLSRLNNVKRAIVEVLEPTIDDGGNLTIKSLGSRDIENLTFKQVRNVLSDIGDLTQFTGNPSDDKLVNSALKRVYGNIKEESLKGARAINPELAKNFEKLTEKYADLSSAEIATKYRDKIVERQALVGMSPQTVGIGTGLITAVATGGATIPAVLVGVSAGVLDKLAQTPGFKTRLAYLLSTKTQQEANYLFRKIPALRRFFDMKKGFTPGDILLNKTKEELKSIPNKQGGFIATAPYKGETDLTTKILKDLEGKTTVSKQYILDATNRPELKQPERDLIRDMVNKEGNTINVSDFAKKVKAELLPLKVNSTKLPKNIDPDDASAVLDYKRKSNQPVPKYENIALPDDLRGNVKDYNENIYESPIKTSAGQTHFGNSSDSYFGHTRIEDMADNKTRRVIEVQSDLYQKGNLEKEFPQNQYNKPTPVKTTLEVDGRKIDFYGDSKETATRKKELSKLQQYNDPTAHFRMVREEIKKAAQDGKTKLQFPTGETAMKIEGLGDTTLWAYADDTNRRVMPDEMKVGMSIVENRPNSIGDNWIITDVLGDGKFKAIPANAPENGELFASPDEFIEFIKSGERMPEDLFSSIEQFDISGKVDTNNPIYKFYEKDVQKYLNKFGGKKVTDDKGVSWIEIPIKKEMKGAVEAFGKAQINPLLMVAGAGAGLAGASKLLTDRQKVETPKSLPIEAPKKVKISGNKLLDDATTTAKQKFGVEVPPQFLRAVFDQENSSRVDKKNLRRSMGLTDIAMKELGKDALPNTSIENVFKNSAMFLAKKSKLVKEDGRIIDLSKPEKWVEWYVQRYVGLLPGQSRLIDGEKVPYEKIAESFKKKLEQFK